MEVVTRNLSQDFSKSFQQEKVSYRFYCSFVDGRNFTVSLSTEYLSERHSIVSWLSRLTLDKEIESQSLTIGVVSHWRKKNEFLLSISYQEIINLKCFPVH